MFLRLDAVNRHFTLSLQPVKVTVLRQDTQTLYVSLHYVSRKTDKEKKRKKRKILRPTPGQIICFIAELVVPSLFPP